jgi:hypothetical protein
MAATRSAKSSGRTTSGCTAWRIWTPSASAVNVTDRSTTSKGGIISRSSSAIPARNTGTAASSTYW